MMAQKDDLLAIRNAIENASTVPVGNQIIVGVLRGEHGHGSHLRALFGDVSLAELARVGRLHGINVPTILAAYKQAKVTALAANAELDQALADACYDDERLGY